MPVRKQILPWQEESKYVILYWFQIKYCLRDDACRIIMQAFAERFSLNVLQGSEAKLVRNKPQALLNRGGWLFTNYCSLAKLEPCALYALYFGVGVFWVCACG